jgi:sialic acid synthase SpsE/sugar phosphate isomerase/epimerase
VKITKNLSKWIVQSEDSIPTALAKIEANMHGFVVVVNEAHICRGVLTDGDVRRHLITHNAELRGTVIDICNQTFRFAYEDEVSTIELNEQIRFMPIIERGTRRLSAISTPSSVGMDIRGFDITRSSPAYIIAEIGNNHNGSLALAKKLVDSAKATGADCAKFQYRDLGALYRSTSDASHAHDLGAEYTLDLLDRFQLSEAEMFEIFTYCDAIGITPMCTPWDSGSLKSLQKYNLPGYKVASADLTNHPFLEELSLTGKPLIISTGMARESEIRDTIRFLNQLHVEYALLHCNSTYPAPFKDINLRYLTKLKTLTDGPVGYSGHERGADVAVAAVAMGATIVEKHFTLDKSMEGNDHKVSLLPDEFTRLVQAIRNVEAALGTSQRVLSQGEMMNRENLAKSLVATADFKKGDVITRDKISIKSPGQGLQPMRRPELVGKKANRDIKAGDFFFESDLKDQFIVSPRYAINRPIGIPVRYHDFKALESQTALDFVEFHLSYCDLEINPEKHLKGCRTKGFAVHAPELFYGDHLLNLAADEANYLEKSIVNLQEVINQTRVLRRHFPATKKPVIIVNAGGFSGEAFLSEPEKQQLYARVTCALGKLDQSDVEISLQTMPPFPWHFGGQQFHNLFVMPDEIAVFASENNVKICLDISHTMMAANYFGFDIWDAIATIGPHVSHLHIADAEGVDGEGVEFGRGDVDFGRMMKCLEQHCPNVQFVPEVWQGHKNTGEGFWRGLDFLETACRA